MTTEKIHYTKHDLKEPDEFVSGVGKTVTWIKANRERVIVIAVAVVLLVGGAIGGTALMKDREEKATAALWPHVKQVRDLTAATGQPDVAKVQAAEQALLAYLSQNSGRDASVYALYYLGNVVSIRGDHAQAADHYRAAIASGKVKGDFGYFLRFALANSLESKGDVEGAVKSYREASEISSGEMKIEARLGEARVLASGGKKPESEAIYRQLLLDNPKDEQLKEIVELRLTQAG